MSNLLPEIKILINLYERLRDDNTFHAKMDSLVNDEIISKEAGNIMLDIIGSPRIRAKVKTEHHTPTKTSRKTTESNYDPCSPSLGRPSRGSC